MPQIIILALLLQLIFGLHLTVELLLQLMKLFLELLIKAEKHKHYQLIVVTISLSSASFPFCQCSYEPLCCCPTPYSCSFPDCPLNLLWSICYLPSVTCEKMKRVTIQQCRAHNSIKICLLEQQVMIDVTSFIS